MTISAEAIRNMRPGDVLKDHVVEGLELHAKTSGASWFLYYRNRAGVRRRPRLGSLKALTLEAARRVARALNERIAAGEDPSQDRQTYRASPTVADLSDEYIRVKATRDDKPRTLDEKKRRARLYIKPLLGKLKVVDVKLKDINEALDKIAASQIIRREMKGDEEIEIPMGGTTVARHVRSDLSGMFRFAEHDDYKWRPRDTNPVRDAQTFKKPKRRRHLRGDEAPKVAIELDKLADEYPQRVAALWIILLAGTRVTELVTAKRSMLNGKSIVLSEHKTDATGDERVIVLPGQALAILEKLPDDGSGYLFGKELANLDGKDRARQLIRTVWEKARERAGCPDLRVQDFRRTFASAAFSAGRSSGAIGELLGHKDSKTTDAYTWLFNEAAEKAAQDTADELEKRMRGNG